MAAILGCSYNRFLARVHSQRKPGNGRHPVAGAVMGTSGGAAVVDYFGFRDPWCCTNCADSVRNAQTFFEIRVCIGGHDRIQQQYRGLTAHLQYPLSGRTN
jgi:hypothetical protein